MAVIPVLVLGIPILTDNYRGYKCLGESLLVYKRGYRHTTDYIRGFRIIVEAIRPVRYLASNYSRKFAGRVLRRVWELGTNHLINQIRG